MNKLKEENKENKRVFIDAAFSTIYSNLLIMFGYSLFYLILFSPIIRSLYKKYLHESLLSVLYDRLFIILIVSFASFPIILLSILLILKIKYGIYRKITTDEDGIILTGLLKIYRIKWDEIRSLSLCATPLLSIIRTIAGEPRIKMAGISSIKGKKYYFSLSMKEKSQEYPAYHYRDSLIDQNENKIKEINPEECPLYIEIQRHLSKK